MKESSMITNLNLRKADNGYFLNYHEDGKSKDRVFYTWAELSTWMQEQVESQDKK